MFVLFCLSKKEPKKDPRNRYTARLREGASINSCTTVASTVVTLLLDSIFLLLIKTVDKLKLQMLNKLKLLIVLHARPCEEPG